MALKRLMMEEIQTEENPQLALFSPKQFHDRLDQVQTAQQTKTDPVPFSVDLADCREDSRGGIGVRQAFDAVYDRLGWESLFGFRRTAAKRMIREMVLARIARLQSNRSSLTIRRPLPIGHFFTAQVAFSARSGHPDESTAPASEPPCSTENTRSTPLDDQVGLHSCG